MSEQNKAIVRRMYDEVIGQGKLELIDELVDEKMVDHETTPGMAPGREGLRQAIPMFRSAFPDLRMTAETLVSDQAGMMEQLGVGG